MTTVSQAIALARQYLQAGRFDAVVQICHPLIQQQPAGIEVWYLLGLASHRLGQVVEAVNCYQKVLTLKPDSFPVLNNLGAALKAQGRLEEAEQCYQQAIQLNSSYPEAYNNLGNLRQQQGRVSDAIAAYREALVRSPEYWDARQNLSLVLQQQGQVREAIALYQEGLRLQPDHAEGYNDLGNFLQRVQQFKAAIPCYQKALELDPQNASFYNNLGAAYQELGQLEDSVTAYQNAIALNPNYADAYYNLGNTRRDQGQLEAAIAAYQQAIALNPNYPDAYNNLGLVLCDRGQLDASIAAYRQALSLDPHYADAHLNLGLSLLLSGALAAGFAEYEWRWQVKGPNFKPPRAFDQPQWDGSDLQGKTLLLHAEQGFGDTLQFIRYVPQVAAKGGRVVVECQSQLKRLIEPMQGVEQVVAQGDRLPEFEVHAPLLSLPHLLHTTLDTVPATVPYLSPPDTAKVLIEPNPPDCLKVGFVWSGSPTHGNDRHRSCPLACFEPLFRLPGMCFFSLQKGDRAQELMPWLEQSPIQNLSPDCHDFGDTAEAIAQLDLIITVDTAVAHLAGALGKPVWILLAFAPDWRWMLHREDSPWYPTAKLFRQNAPGDWSEVMARVAQSLQALQTLSSKQAESGREALTDQPESPDLPPSPPTPVQLPFPAKSPDRQATSHQATSNTESLSAIGIGWELSATTGWGIYGTNLALQLQRHAIQPIPLLPPLNLADFNPLHRARLFPLFQEQRRLEQVLQQHPHQTLTGNFPVLKGLGNHFVAATELSRVRGQRNIGVIFFEDTEFSSADLRRAEAFDAIVTGSSWNAEILKQAGLPQVRMVPQGIDPTLFHPAPRSQLWGDRFVIFSGGKLEYRKGQDIVVAAFRQFQSRHPEAMLWVAWHNLWPETMSGLEQSNYVQGLPATTPHGRLQLGQWLVQNGIPSNAFMDLGLIPNPLVGQILREADVAVFPNRCEGGTNLAAMESLACGVPTVLSANTGHLDLIDDAHCYPLRDQRPSKAIAPYRGVDGWGESNVEELVETLETIYTHRAQSQQKGAAAARFMQNWTWEHQVNRLLTVLKDEG